MGVTKNDEVKFVEEAGFVREPKPKWGYNKGYKQHKQPYRLERQLNPIGADGNRLLCKG